MDIKLLAITARCHLSLYIYVYISTTTMRDRTLSISVAIKKNIWSGSKAGG